jgi:hypothetical protein
MTEVVQGDGQNLSNFAPAAPSPAPQVQTPAPASADERTFRQSEVNDLVGRAKAEAIERYKRDTSMSSHQTYQTPPSHAPAAPITHAYAPPANAALSESQVRQLAAEESQRMRNDWITENHRSQQEQEAKRIASEFFTKLDAGKANLPDFDKVMSKVDLRTIPDHVQLANMVDNTAAVMYELINNPVKIGQIQNLIDIDQRAGRTPALALAEMQRISQSIKDNAKGANFKAPNEPLSRLHPSTAGTDTGALGVADYKRRYKV